jgi:hypothetical protein
MKLGGFPASPWFGDDSRGQVLRPLADQVSWAPASLCRVQLGFRLVDDQVNPFGFIKFKPSPNRVAQLLRSADNFVGPDALQHPRSIADTYRTLGIRSRHGCEA